MKPFTDPTTPPSVLRRRNRWRHYALLGGLVMFQKGCLQGIINSPTTGPWAKMRARNIEELIQPLLHDLRHNRREFPKENEND